MSSPSGSTTLWDKLFKPRKAQEELVPDFRDKKGVQLYVDFEECIQDNKLRVLGAVWVVTIPWSFKKKTIGPFVLGTIIGLMPELMYANWRCDAQYKAFSEHARAHAAAKQLQEQQEAGKGDAPGGSRGGAGGVGGTDGGGSDGGAGGFAGKVGRWLWWLPGGKGRVTVVKKEEGGSDTQAS